MNPLSHLSLWLHPAARDEPALRAEIGRLATRWGSPPFAPHLTLVGGFDAPEDEARRRAADLASELGPLDVEFTTLASEEPLHKSLFLGAAPNARLDAAFGTAVRICAGPVGEEPFRPHLSLAYLDAPAELRERAAASIALSLPVRARFDALALWRTPMPVVEDWRRVDVWAL
ncbi:2'-5' RNA ligase family protein [uncultured Streptomyces sp.]|uniref:2'-5' RNA ligase family protein n=1 Tax=uncultured Streptomyces sp. TaxID=174707 RepID=UPI00260B1300|nr:2'-5' RNA ligase family protein [uncultured Streptomyces sp.]